jgi:hypothetical protein
VQVSVPPQLWRAPDAAVQRDDSARAPTSSTGSSSKPGRSAAAQDDATGSASTGASCSGPLATDLADALAAFLALNCNYQRVPGSGAARKGRGTLSKSSVWKRFPPGTTVTGVNPDGTLALR